MSRLSVVGLNHRTASLELRGGFSFEGEGLQHGLSFLREKGVSEALILSTCNRTEVYAYVDGDTPLLELLHRRQRGLGSGFYRHLYRKHDEEAIRHLFSVAAGLDSKILGENEIQGQLRRAVTASREEGLSGRQLRPLVDHAIRTGKRVRSETEVGRSVLSMASLAVRTALGDRRDFGGRTVAVIGTGDIARRVLKELRAYAPARLLVVSRSESRAEMLAGEFGGEARLLTDLENVLRESSVVFSATHSETHLIHRDLSLSNNLRIADLAVPATVEPEVGELPGVFLANVDDLTATLTGNQKAREQAAVAAHEIVDGEVRAYVASLRETDVLPLVSSLHRKGQDIGQEQFQWALGKMGELSESQTRVLEVLTNRLVNRLLHHPLTELRTLADDREGLEIARRLLGLDTSAQDGRVA